MDDSFFESVMFGLTCVSIGSFALMLVVLFFKKRHDRKMAGKDRQ